MKPTLSDLTAFAMVARRRSFRAAADEMGVSRSSLSHALRGLEAQLGVRLLHRTTRSVAPTEAGTRLLARLTPALGELDAMLAEVGGDADGPAGPLRINALHAASRWLMRHVVPGFLNDCPRVALDVVTNDRFVDIVADGFDAGVRLLEAVPQDMIAVPFGGEVRFVAVASPAYLADREEPKTPDDLRSHRCIRQRLASGKPYRWEFARGDQEIAIDVPGALTLNDNALMVEAAIDGLGIAFVPQHAAKAGLASGRLRILLHEWCPPIPGLCLYYPGHHHVRQRCERSLKAYAPPTREKGRQKLWLDRCLSDKNDRYWQRRTSRIGCRNGKIWSIAKMCCSGLPTEGEARDRCCGVVSLNPRIAKGCQ